MSHENIYASNRSLSLLRGLLELPYHLHFEPAVLAVFVHSLLNLSKEGLFMPSYEIITGFKDADVVLSGAIAASLTLLSRHAFLKNTQDKERRLLGTMYRLVTMGMVLYTADIIAEMYILSGSRAMFTASLMYAVINVMGMISYKSRKKAS